MRFEEDRLRLLRAVRFSVVLGLPVEARTWDALLEFAPSIVEVSAERIRDEIEKMLVHPRREYAYHLLSDSGLMGAILPEVESMRGVEQPPEYHPEGDVHVHTGLVLSHLNTPDFALALAALLHDVGKPGTYEVSDRIRFNRHDTLGADMSEEICERSEIPGCDLRRTACACCARCVSPLFSDYRSKRAPGMRFSNSRRASWR